jgi:hypothetical protein
MAEDLGRLFIDDLDGRDLRGLEVQRAIAPRQIKELAFPVVDVGVQSLSEIGREADVGTVHLTLGVVES